MLFLNLNILNLSEFQHGEFNRLNLNELSLCIKLGRFISTQDSSAETRIIFQTSSHLPLSYFSYLQPYEFFISTTNIRTKFKMRFSDILGLAVFLSSATGMPTRPVLCGDDYCTCLTGPEALGPGFGTPEECIAYAKENNYDDWLRKREIPLPIRRDSDVDFFCNNDPDFLGYDTLDDCIACAEDNDDCPDNVDWPEKRGNPSPIRRDSSPSSFNDDFDVLSEREDSQGPCTGKLDLCITIIVPNNVEKSFSVRFDEDTALGRSAPLKTLPFAIRYFLT